MTSNFYTRQTIDILYVKNSLNQKRKCKSKNQNLFINFFFLIIYKRKMDTKAAEIAARREARMKKILENSTNRLGRIRGEPVEDNTEGTLRDC